MSKKIEGYDLIKPLVGGGFMVSREQYETDMRLPGAPVGYSYDEFVADHTESEEQYRYRMGIA